MTDYLPKHATNEQACAWLHARTGQSWSLARLMECGFMPWVWLDYTPGYPSIFGDRLEGYLAPMVFGGDTERLEADGTFALITMTRTHEGIPMKINPGIRAPLSELRFKREDIEAMAAPNGAPESKAPRRHVYKQPFQENEILRVIRELEYDPKALPKDTPGKSGIKAEVRALLPNFSITVFNKAWERLSTAGDIIKPK